MSIMTPLLKTVTIVPLVVIFYILGSNLWGMPGISDFCMGMISGIAATWAYIAIEAIVGD